MDKTFVLIFFVFLVVGLLGSAISDFKRARRMQSGEFYQRIEK